MCTLRYNMKLIASLFTVLTLPLSATEQKTFTSAKYGYKVRLPKTWNVSVSAAGIPVFFNYDPSEALPQGLIPEHGAEIYLIPFANVQPVTGTKNLTDWIQFNNARGRSNIVVKRLSTSRSEREPHDAVEVDSDFERDPQDEVLQRVTDYYFTLRGEKFRLMLVHWKGDQQSAHFRLVLDSVFRSIESR